MERERVEREKSRVDERVPTTPVAARRVSGPSTLVVGRVDDPAERAADRAADAIVAALKRPESGAPGAGRIRRAAHGSAPVAGRSTTASGGRVRRATAPAASLAGGPLDADTSRRVEAARSGGAPLPGVLREPMEQALSTPLDHVRVHTGPEAASLSDSISARAFSTGSDIFFNAGQFRPDSLSGQRLLAHEVAHTVQSGPVPGRVVRRSVDESAQVRDLDRMEFQQSVALLDTQFDIVLGQLPNLATMAIQAAVQPELIGALEGIKASVVAMLAPTRFHAQRVQEAWAKLGSAAARSMVLPPEATQAFTGALSALPAQLDRWTMYLQTVVPGNPQMVMMAQQEMSLARALVCGGHAQIAAASAKDGSTRGGSQALLGSIRGPGARANLRHVGSDPDDRASDDRPRLGRVVPSRAELMADIRSHGANR